jgi:hypothetical protein
MGSLILGQRIQVQKLKSLLPHRVNSKQKYMNYRNFNSADLWHKTPIAKPQNLPKTDLFRISLRDLDEYFWRPNGQNRDILKNLFNRDYYDQHCIVTDSESMTRLKPIFWSADTKSYEGGFIYCYTEQNHVLAGKGKEGFWFWESTRYDATFKCGMSDRHPLKRIHEQYKMNDLDNNPATSKPSPPILLSLLWTGRAFLAEREIHTALDERRVTDNQGNSFRNAGAEWFIDRPENMIRIAHPIVMKHRNNPEEEREIATMTTAIAKNYSHDRIVESSYSSIGLVHPQYQDYQNP